MVSALSRWLTSIKLKQVGCGMGSDGALRASKNSEKLLGCDALLINLRHLPSGSQDRLTSPMQIKVRFTAVRLSVLVVSASLAQKR